MFGKKKKEAIPIIEEKKKNQPLLILGRITRTKQ